MSNVAPHQIKALLFDKDGTLFDFRATWEAWAGRVLDDITEGDEDLRIAASRAIGFDPAERRFQRDSIAIAGTNAEIAQALCTVLPHDQDSLQRTIVEQAKTAPLAPAADLPRLLKNLRALGYKVGVMTNDSFSVAKAHLTNAGVIDLFDMVIGADSGYGAKPAPQPLEAFCAHVGVDPVYTAMIGDSTHDLQAARAAGMVSVGVLTGMAGVAELSGLSDIVLGDISELPMWLGHSG